LQNPLFQKAKENLLPGEKVPFRADEVCMESPLTRPSPSVCDGPPLPEDGGYSWDDGFCDYAFGSAQNDSIGGDV